ncbi:MAG: hypothetical protein KA313_01720, partial [Pseudarcicella sp.]|nr:hypothetical protein [Pseudarcicella sp.]
GQTNKSIIRNNVFDASSISSNGVEILNEYSAKPNKGVLDTFSVSLPNYESVVFISTIGREKILDGMNRVFSWAAKDLKTIVSKGFEPDSKAGGEPSRNGLLALFKLKNEEFLLLQGITSPTAMSYLMISDDGKLSINLATFGTDSVSGNIPLITYAKGKNVYDVFQAAWKNAIATNTTKGRSAMRHEKVYPEIFKYLGWCSWEQYHTKVSSDLMVDAMQKIEKSTLPIRWVLLDNGHEHIYKSIDLMNSSRMLSFKANPETFPNGFKPMMDAKTTKIKWTGIWHTMNAHWQGLHPEHEIRELDPHLVKVKKNINENFDVMMPKGDSLSSRKFYNALVMSTKQHGFDFIKIDNQNRQMAFYQGMSNPVAIVSQHAQSLECASQELSSGLMNCFCLDFLNLMNTKYSAISRVSVDYLLNNEAKAKSHLLQSYQNTLWMGQAVWPDHDMFHSSDKFCGRMMAVSKAMSGAPIYLSDAPVDFQDKLVLPLSYSDGELLRPLAPAVPLPESVMLSALTSPEAYRVVAPLQNGAAAFVAYNLMHPAPSSKVTSAFSAKDYEAAGEFIQPKVESWKVPKEGLVYFDWYEQKGAKLVNEYKFDLVGFTDKLVQLSPIVKGWSVVGNTSKYLAASAVKSVVYNKKELKVVMNESSELLVYNLLPISCSIAQKIENIGNGMWKLYLPESKKNLELVITLKK